MKVPIKDIIARNYGRAEDDEAHIILADIKDKGILVPLLVRKTPRKYMLIDGMRRYKAAKALGFTEVEVRIIEL